MANENQEIVAQPEIKLNEIMAESLTNLIKDLSAWSNYRVQGLPLQLTKEAFEVWLSCVIDYSGKLLNASTGDAYLRQHETVNEDNVKRAKTFLENPARDY